MTETTVHFESRRRFVARVSALGGGAALNIFSKASCAEPPPDIERIRLVQAPTYCLAPQYLAEDLLRAEGFADIQYVNTVASIVPPLAVGAADISMLTVPDLVPAIDQGLDVIALAGVHAGCFELFGNDRIRAVHDLKGRNVATSGRGGADHILVSSMAAYVGVNPRDIVWIETSGPQENTELFKRGKVDAFLAFPPEPQLLRVRKIGHVIVNTVLDRPWRQYFCCVVAANRNFLDKYPIAAKRALRAFLKAADICAGDPERAARFFVDKGYDSRYALTLEIIKSLPFDRWRHYDPEDTFRFHAIRLHEVGMIRSNPEEIIARGTDWRFLRALKSELKA